MKKRSWYIAVALLLAAFGIFLVFSSRDREETPQTMYVNSDVCRVRAGAGEEFAVVGLLAKGERIIILEEAAGTNEQFWYKIDKESLPEDLDVSSVEECYILSELLSKDENLK